MSTLNRPQECINANCTAMCCLADYEFYKGMFKDDARKCPHYKTEPMIPISVFEDIKAEIKEEAAIASAEIIENGRQDLINYKTGLNYCLEILDQHINGKGDKE